MPRLPAIILALLLFPSVTRATSLESDLGRSEIRIKSEAYPLQPGRSVVEMALPQRLHRQGYTRVHGRPTSPGQFFWGHERFWIYRRAHRWRGRNRRDQLFALEIQRASSVVKSGLLDDGRRVSLAGGEELWLEPEILAEALEEEGTPRVPVPLDQMPEMLWRSVLAAEDSRFFEHRGVDGKALARALLANARAGKVVQGGSTITQQLVKNRDLTPKRSLGRKVSEAIRALALEAEHTKEDILESYLNHVYLGHVDGLAIHGMGAAAQVYFSLPLADLDLAQSALLAGIIQGPNRLSPLRHPHNARKRRDWVLVRLRDLGWADSGDVDRAQQIPVRTRPSHPLPPPARSFRAWIAAQAQKETPRRLDKGRGLVVETTLDLQLQLLAEESVKKHLERLRRQHKRLRSSDLSAALVALDATSGDVLAYVGGDPGHSGDRFDRARQARRQPGSSVKPLVLLEAFDSCGGRQPLHPATRVSDGPLEVQVPSGAWRPQNPDQVDKGSMTLRQALVESRNLPFVRVGLHCGLGPTAQLFRRAGLTLPATPPPAFLLGAVETNALELASAFTVFSSPGRVLRPRSVRRMEKPGGWPLEGFPRKHEKLSRASSAYLVHNILQDAVLRGTGSPGQLQDRIAAGKTGTSSDLRDAWFVGQAGSLVTAVWVGLDSGSALGLSGSRAAAPLWALFMDEAVSLRPPYEVKRPRDVVSHRVHPSTGLRVRSGGKEEIFRRGVVPRKDRFLLSDRPEPALE